MHQKAYLGNQLRLITLCLIGQLNVLLVSMNISWAPIQIVNISFPGLKILIPNVSIFV